MFTKNEHGLIIYKLEFTMTATVKEQDTLQRVLDTFQETTGLTVERRTAETGAGIRPDAVIQIPFQGKKHLFAAEVKNVLTPTTLGAAVHRLQDYLQKGLLVTRYITPPMADKLKQMEIPFLDMAGNAYINDPPLFIFIKGNKLPEDYRPEPITRAFQPGGLITIFTLLCNPGLENTPYRNIAKITALALGTIGWVMDDLKRLGYLVDMGARGRRLVRKDVLLTRWVAAYPDQLRPKLIIGRFKADDDNWWEKAEIEKFHALWGGEVAAAKLTEYLKPQMATIYAQELPARLVLKYKLKKDPAGNIEILKPFWNFEYPWTHPVLVPPILIYADLLATGDARNIETARLIYEKEIARLVRED